MASNRHLGRIVAMQTLYELDFRIEMSDKSLDIAAVLDRNIGRYSEIMDDQAFVKRLVEGVLDLHKTLDEFIQPLAPEWPLNQIARIDRILLRMGVWELQHLQNEVPVKVVINEAVELAKSFGADNSSKFVNGVLGTAARNLGLSDEEAPKKATDTKDTPKKEPKKKEPSGNV